MLVYQVTIIYQYFLALYSISLKFKPSAKP